MTTQTTPTPAFWRRFARRYKSGIAHAFLLHGNVYDYQPLGEGYAPLLKFLTTRMASLGKDIILIVDPARGLQFPVPAHRELLINVLKLGAGAPAPAAGSLAGAVSATSKPPEVKLPNTLAGMTALIDRLISEPLEHPIDKARGDDGEILMRPTYNKEGQVTGQEETPKPIETAILFLRADLFFPDAEVARMREEEKQTMARLLNWSRDLLIGQRHMLFLLAETLLGLHSELRRDTSRWDQIEILRPDLTDRTAYTEHRITRLAADGDELPLAPGLDAPAIARATAILTLEQCEDVLYAGLEAGRLTREMIVKAKQDAVAREFGDVAQIDDARFTFAGVGGYKQFKENATRYVIGPWVSGGKLSVPAILLTGPAGAGKTQLAEAMAGEAGVPFVVWRPGNILGQYVGNSERNFDRFKRAVMNMGNCIVFIDELDQAIRRGGDSGGSQVDNRIFGGILNWMEDPARLAAGVLIVAATNYPNLLDGALLSRFPMVIPILPPVSEDRFEIIEVLAETHMGAKRADLDAGALAQAVMQTDGWVGRDLRALCMTAKSLMDGDATCKSPSLAILNALDLILPKKKDMAAQIALALDYTSDLRFLPAEWRDKARSQALSTPTEFADAADPAYDAVKLEAARSSRRRKDIL